MKPNVRMHAIALVAVAGALGAGTAQAGTVTTTNACLYSINDEYRNQTVTLTGVGSPAGAPPGTPATLSGASLSATLPLSLPEQGYNLGIFSEGYNAIPSKVWIAIAASNATPAVQVKELSVVASTTIVLRNGPGSEFVSGTPIVVTIPIPDTTWTVAAAGPVSFSQAGPATLPSLPVGTGDKVQPVIGSIVVKPTLGTLRFVLDCQPGTTVSPFQDRDARRRPRRSRRSRRPRPCRRCRRRHRRRRLHRRRPRRSCRSWRSSRRARASSAGASASRSPARPRPRVPRVALPRHDLRALAHHGAEGSRRPLGADRRAAVLQPAGRQPARRHARADRCRTPPHELAVSHAARARHARARHAAPT